MAWQSLIQHHQPLNHACHRCGVGGCQPPHRHHGGKRLRCAPAWTGKSSGETQQGQLRKQHFCCRHKHQQTCKCCLVRQGKKRLAPIVISECGNGVSTVGSSALRYPFHRDTTGCKETCNFLVKCAARMAHQRRRLSGTERARSSSTARLHPTVMHETWERTIQVLMVCVDSNCGTLPSRPGFPALIEHPCAHPARMNVTPKRCVEMSMASWLRTARKQHPAGQHAKSHSQLQHTGNAGTSGTGPTGIDEQLEATTVDCAAMAAGAAGASANKARGSATHALTPPSRVPTE